MGLTKRFQCACCGYYTFEHEPNDSFDICPVCYWEDDIYQVNLASEILVLPKDMELTEADVKRGMAKIIRLAKENGKYPVYVTRAR